jgi:hypothetical protein
MIGHAVRLNGQLVHGGSGQPESSAWDCKHASAMPNSSPMPSPWAELRLRVCSVP